MIISTFGFERSTQNSRSGIKVAMTAKSANTGEYSQAMNTSNDNNNKFRDSFKYYKQKAVRPDFGRVIDVARMDDQQSGVIPCPLRSELVDARYVCDFLYQRRYCFFCINLILYNDFIAIKNLRVIL